MIDIADAADSIRTRRKPRQIETLLQGAYSDDIIGEYLAQLQNELGVTLNQAALDQVDRRQHSRRNRSRQTYDRAADSVFAQTYARGEPQVVWTTLVADLETPVSAFLKLGGGNGDEFLLESVEGGAVRGRYSIIGLDPDLIWRTSGERAEDQPPGAHSVRRVRALQRAAARRRCAR